MSSPYSDLPARAFWRTGVAERARLDPGDLYVPRFPVTRRMRIATAGSCFAQHVGRALRDSGFNVIDAEPLPAAISDTVANRFGYRLFSARYGNIYTARHLAQLFDEAEGVVRPADPVWRRGERFFDSQRPGVEPDGLPSEELVRAHRARHLAAVGKAFRAADLFVFTFGLTETWIHTDSNTVYPTAPGTIAGAFDPARHSFKNYDAFEVLADFERFRTRLKAINPDVRFLVTVSPVPLTATASGSHVEVATCYSKSVLRAVCGMLLARHEDVDYFPSYEVVTSQSACGDYFEDNRRSVTAAGVATAMSLFLRAHDISSAPVRTGRKRNRKRRPATVEDAVCEDLLLDAFAP